MLKVIFKHVSNAGVLQHSNMVHRKWNKVPDGKSDQILTPE
jgi:hypothetical protein